MRLVAWGEPAVAAQGVLGQAGVFRDLDGHRRTNESGQPRVVAGYRSVVDGSGDQTGMTARAREFAALGWGCYAVEDLDQARGHWEAAFRTYRDCRDVKKQAELATCLGRVHRALGNDAASRGWLNRARRLLDRCGRCVEQGYLELALLACEVADASELALRAARALELALEFGDSELEARALADSGLALVSQGQLTEGFARLDEAMVPVIAGEVVNGGAIFCSMLSACERVGDVRRAEEWIRLCQEMVLDGLDGRWPVLHAHCRLVYGTVLCEAGRWVEAEAEIMHALGPSGTSMVARRAEGLARLADLRIRQDRLEEAAQLLYPVADRFEAAGALARLHVAQGDLDLASSVINAHVDQLGSDLLRSGPLLGLLVQVELSRGNVDAAENTERRLTKSSEAAESQVLIAHSLLAQGRVARERGDHVSARACLLGALGAVDDEECRILAATIRVEIARAAAAEGDVPAAVTAARAALALFDRVGARRDANQALALLRALGAPTRSPGARTDRPADALTPRQREVLGHIAHGASNSEIATRLFISSKTVEHHVGSILSRLDVRTRAEAVALTAANEVAPN